MGEETCRFALTGLFAWIILGFDDAIRTQADDRHGAAVLVSAGAWIYRFERNREAEAAEAKDVKIIKIDLRFTAPIGYLNVLTKMDEWPPGHYVSGIAGDPFFGYCTIEFDD